MPRIFWIGVVLLVAGTGPLLAMIALASLGLTRDPNPNPIGLGLLAMVTFWPGVAVVAAGVARRRRS